MATKTLKVGDKVKSISGAYHRYDFNPVIEAEVIVSGRGWVNLKIISATNTDWQASQNNSFFFSKNELEKITTAMVSPRDFMVGDIVELVSLRGGAPVLGDWGVINDIIPPTLYINFPSQSGYEVDASAIKLIEQFNVSDLVMFTDYTHHNDFSEHTNQIATITGKTSDGNYKIKWLSDNTTGSEAWLSEKYWGMYKVDTNGNPLQGEAKKIRKTNKSILKTKFEKVLPHTILGQDRIKNHLRVAIKHNISVLLVGETGTGKTTIVKDLADEHKRQWLRFNLTGETTVDEFVGKYTLQAGETKWEDGVLLTAMKKGYWLIVDEVNVALPEILFVLHSLLDDDKSVLVSNHLGEIVKPDENFRFFGTMNPVDEYAGTKELNKAFKSRFGMIENMEYPTADIETEILVHKAGITKSVACILTDVATRVREAKKKNEVFYTCSTRDLIQWGSLIDELNLVDAFEVAVLNKANGDGVKVNQIFKDITGKYVTESKAGRELNIDKLVKISEELEADRKDFEAHKEDTKKQIVKEIVDGLVKENKDNIKSVKKVKAIPETTSQPTETELAKASV